ncbi:MAG: MFS transporter [Spirochaetaceae bacterium]|nr:MFS transporter [Spirochaetaceae bacterium]
MSDLPRKLHEFLTDDELRSCEDIPDNQCKVLPGNFFKNVANGTLSKLAERLIHPGLTLPWVLGAMGASSVWIGFLVPIKDGGSLLPQIFVAGTVRALSKRKWLWVAAAVVQSLCLALAGLVLLYLSHPLSTACFLTLFGLFSISSGVGSLAYKDVTAKTVPSGQRGAMLSYRALLGGLLAVPAGLGLIFYLGTQASTVSYAYLLFGTAGLWFLAALVFASIREMAGATSGGRSPAKEIRAGLAILKEDSNFRRFMAVRALLFALPLMLPYLSLMARSGSSSHGIGLLILVGGVAELVSSPFWGRFSDRASQGLMMTVSLMGGVIGALALLGQWLLSDSLLFYASLVLIFVHSIAYSGARLARKTYLVDYAPAEDRATYVSLANTFMGFFTLAASAFGGVAFFLGQSGQIAFLVILLLLCGILAKGLRPPA